MSDYWRTRKTQRKTITDSVDPLVRETSGKRRKRVRKPRMKATPIGYADCPTCDGYFKLGLGTERCYRCIRRNNARDCEKCGALVRSNITQHVEGRVLCSSCQRRPNKGAVCPGCKSPYRPFWGHDLCRECRKSNTGLRAECPGCNKMYNTGAGRDRCYKCATKKKGKER